MERMRDFPRLKLVLLAVVGLGVALAGGAQIISQTAPEDELVHLDVIQIAVETGYYPPEAKARLAELDQQGLLPDVVDPTAVAAHVAEYEAAHARTRQDYIAWLEAFNASGTDPRTLEWVERDGFYDRGPDTIDDAVREAELIVYGRVVSAEFRPWPDGPESTIGGDTFVQFLVERVLAGDVAPGDEIPLIFGGGPMPLQDTPGAPPRPVISYYAVDPLMLEGDEAILLLKESPRFDDHFYGQAWTGVNKIVSGVVQANLRPYEDINELGVDDTPLRGEFHGQTPESLMALLEEAIARVR